MDWPLSEVGTGLEQQICYISHHLIIWPCLTGPETENTHTHIILHSPTILPQKFHHYGAWIIPCLEEPSTPSAIFQHRRLPNGRNWATVPDIFQGGRSFEEKSRPSTAANSEKSAIVPQKVRLYWTKPLPSVQPNCVEDDEGKEYTSFQHKFHMSPSVPSIISPEVPVPPPMVYTAQPPRVDKVGPSSNLISRGKETPIPLYALTAQFQKPTKPM